MIVVAVSRLGWSGVATAINTPAANNIKPLNRSRRGAGDAGAASEMTALQGSQGMPWSVLWDGDGHNRKQSRAFGLHDGSGACATRKPGPVACGVVAGELRDYEAWLRDYDDPDSGLSWRLDVVRSAIAAALDTLPGPVGIVSVCAGDGRDVIGVLAARPERLDVSATLLEIHPGIADRARTAAKTAGLSTRVRVQTLDAGMSDAYLDLVPAELVLLVGVFGNISHADLHRTIAASPQLCAPDAWLIWTRGRGGELMDCNDDIRASFRDAGFTELNYVSDERGSRPAVGTVRYHGVEQPLQARQRWFTFLR